MQTTVIDDSVLEPPMTVEEAYAVVPDAMAEDAGFSQTRKCGHWRS